MLKIEVTGNDVGELYQNAMNCFLLLTQGGNTLFKPAPVVQPEPEMPAVAEVTEAIPEPNPPVVEPPKKRGPKAKAPPVVIEATATEMVDDDPLGLGDSKPAQAQPAPELTVDDVRARTKAIIDATVGEDGKPNLKTLAAVRELLSSFGVQTAGKLTPDQFADYMAKSEPLLNGSAK